MNNANQPLLSICITSYNRLNTLKRCLNSIKTVHPEKIEIVISEDCSPGKIEISEMVSNFISASTYKIKYNCNSVNLGFDRNFRKLIDISSGQYILFVTDDDALLEKNLDLLLDLIPKLSSFSVAFTPYFDSISNKFERKFSNTTLLPSGMSSVVKYLYSSILLSGLIFKKAEIPQYDPELFKDLIYSQVFVFASILKLNNGYYINIPIINYIGDGENSFGKNEAFEKNDLLADRTSYLSNLEFHKKLIRTIKIFDTNFNQNLLYYFSKEYSLKSYTGMHYARKFGKDALTRYWDNLKQLDINLSIVAFIYYLLLKYLGCKISNSLVVLPKKSLLLLRSKV